MPQTNRAADDTAGSASDDAARISKENEESWQVESSLESSHIANVLDELRGIPQREAAGEQLDARVAELIDELAEHIAKLKEEKERLLAIAFGRS